jgi:hypothetical protein
MDFKNFASYLHLKYFKYNTYNHSEWEEIVNLVSPLLSGYLPWDHTLFNLWTIIDINNHYISGVIKKIVSKEIYDDWLSTRPSKFLSNHNLFAFLEYDKLQTKLKTPDTRQFDFEDNTFSAVSSIRFNINGFGNYENIVFFMNKKRSALKNNGILLMNTDFLHDCLVGSPEFYFCADTFFQPFKDIPFILYCDIYLDNLDFSPKDGRKNLAHSPKEIFDSIEVTTRKLLRSFSNFRLKYFVIFPLFLSPRNIKIWKKISYQRWIIC